MQYDFNKTKNFHSTVTVSRRWN